MIMTYSIAKLWVLLLISGVFVSSEVTVENGRYNLLVSFSQNIPFENGENLLSHLKDILKSTSDVLHKAIGLQFLKVKLKIPQSWDVSEWSISVDDTSVHNSVKADILVDNTNDVVFGKLPYANQYGDCRTPGRQIVIPTAFFNDDNEFPKEIFLAREWLKYQYGVFDENGFFGDPLYPSFYRVPGSDANDVKITECTNQEVTYNFIDQNSEDCSTDKETLIQRLNSEECMVQADKNGSENIVSSLMYFQENLHNMQYVCGKDDSHQHNSHARNKQNALCYGESIWSIVSNSKDFKSENKITEIVDIEFSYVKETKPKVVVAWEDNAQLKSKEAIILNAIYKYIIDLPLGSQLRTMSFTDKVLDEDIKSHEINTINEKKSLITELSCDFVSEEDADMDLALEKAIDILSSASTDRNHPEGIIFIITKAGRNLADNLRELLLKHQNIYIKILFFSENAISKEIRESVSGLSNVEAEEVLMTSENEVAYEKLVQNMRETLPSTVDDKETVTKKVQYLSKDSPITFDINDMDETITFWVFSKKQSSNFVLKINQKEIGKTETVWENFGGAILKMSPSSLNEVGNVEFNYPFKSEPLLTHVEVTSKAGKYLSGDVFVHDTSKEESADQMPVIIYARIRFGTAYPIQNSKVTATIKRPDDQIVELDMFDDGKGDPDITKNDGIYSRYFTAFSGKGDYIVTVKIENKGDLSTYGVDENAGYQTCCGSLVKEGTSKLQTFSKEFRTSFSSKNDPPADGYKPSKITDLRIDEVTEEDIILKWSAPGGEADSGKASKYEFKLFCEEEMVTENYIYKMVRILNKPPPKKYGTEQKVTIQILNKTQTFKVGIIAHNEKNKKSDLSNTIEIFRPSENPEIQTPPTVTDPEQTTKVGALAGLIVGCILILACFILAVIYYFKRKLQRKNAAANNTAKNITSYNTNIKPTFKAADFRIKTEPVKRIESFPVLLYTHDQIKDHKETGKDPPLYKADVPVKQWKSLDVINLREEIENETKSLGSLSTIHPTDNLGTNGVR